MYLTSKRLAVERIFEFIRFERIYVWVQEGRIVAAFTTDHEKWDSE